MAVKYRIQVDKDGSQVTATFDVRVTDLTSTELIADFRLLVEGQNLVSDFKPGQKEFTGTRPCTLKNPGQDAPVSFALSSNQPAHQPWSKSDSDTLRGSALRDQSLFAN